jgi:EmrB/QacA subfamily drug resistance transporter
VDDRQGRQHYTVTLAALTFAGIAYALLQTMVVPALPSLREDLHTSTTWVTWVLTSFMLVAAVSTPIIGKLGDQYGKERLLVLCLLVLFVGCVLATFAWDIWSLIAARAVQGFGAGLFPLAFAIVKDEFPAEKTGLAVGIVSSVFAVGGGFGLVLAGVFVDYLSWRWMFGVSALGVGISIVLVHRFVPESPIKTPSRVDVPGAVLLSIGLGAFLLALSEADGWGWLAAPTLGLFAVAVAALWAWVLVERRVAEPMIDMRMFVRRPVLLTNVAALLTGFSMFGTFVLLPNFIEADSRVAGYGFAASATVTGLFLLPNALTGLFGGTLAAAIGRRHGSKFAFTVGLVLGAIGIVVLVPWHDEPWQIVVAMLFQGLGIPMAFAAQAKLIVDSVRPTETGVAGGINTVSRTVGGVIGGQVGAAILTADTIGGTTIPAESAFTLAFAAATVAALVGAAVTLFVTPLRLRVLVPARAK